MTDAPSKKRTANSGSFRKGRTGNPKGRPRKAPPIPNSAFDIVIERKLTLTRNGEPEEVTVEEALQHRTYQDAIAGKAMAQREVLKWLAKRDEWFAKHHPKKIKPISVRYLHDLDEPTDALILLGIVREDQRQSLLEFWSAEAALKRRRAALTDREISHIRRTTRDGDRLRLPKPARE